MKKVLTLLIPTLILFSCQESQQSKILNASKRYTEDFFFKKNLNIEIVEFKIYNEKELNHIEADSVINYFVGNKILSIALKLSGQSRSEFFTAGNPLKLKCVIEAKNSSEFNLYTKKLKALNYEAYEAHAYLKYTTSDLNGNNKQNGICEDCYFLLDKDFKVVDMIFMQ